jgi:hypothetical protein
MFQQLHAKCYNITKLWIILLANKKSGEKCARTHKDMYKLFFSNQILLI